MKKNKLRIGLLLNDMMVCAWVHRMVEIINSSHYASVELVVLNGAQSGTKTSLLKKIKNSYKKIIPVVTNRLLDIAERKFVERGTFLPDAFALRDLSELIQDVPIVEVKPVQKRVSDYFREEDIAAIKQHDVDLLVRVGFRILRGDILQAARYGVWSYHHGDNVLNRGGPAGFWEVMEGWPETGSMLQILSEDIDNGKVLYRSYSCTQQTVTDNKNNLYWKTLSFIPRKLEQLYELGEKNFFAQVDRDNEQINFYSRRLYTQPSPAERARLIAAKTASKLKDKYANKFYFDQWFLMYHVGSGGYGAMWRYKKIIPPKDRFWADPHVIYRQGKYYLFIEEFLFEKNRGHISLMEMDEEGNYSEPVTILERPYHLSYPFVFEFENEYYMVPESAENRTVDLYRCVEFPHRWQHHKTLLSGLNAVDATLYFHQNRWWMFVNIAENEGASSCDELFLFYSDDLFGENWIPHPLNPVISDVKKARPAGKIFSENGRLYRPSQNCSGRYGYGFHINEITCLDETSYQEETVSSVLPDWDENLLATHTYNRAHRLSVIDGQQRTRF